MAKALSRNRRLVLAILLLVYSINFMDRQILGILSEAIKADLKLSDTEIGLLYGASFAFVFAIAGIPIARYADRNKRAITINCSLVVFSIMSAACGLAGNYWHIILARVGVAIGESGTIPPSHSIVSTLYSVEERSTAMAVFSLGPHIGLLLGFAIGGWAGQAFGWRAAFFVAGGIGLMCALASGILLREPAYEQRMEVITPESAWSIFQGMIARATTRHILIGMTLYTVVGYCIIGWLPALLIRTSGLSQGTVGLVLALVIGLAGAVGTFLGGVFADRLGKKKPAWRLQLIVFMLLVVTPFWLAVFLSRNAGATIALAILPGALLGFHFGPTYAMIQSLVAPANRATAASILLFLINAIGLGIGPVTIGILSDALAPTAGLDSLRYALLILPPLCLWAAYHYRAASRTIGEDLKQQPSKA